jgi:hypothetical protein
MGNWWEERSLGEKIALGIGIGVLAVGLAFLFGWVVMLLWNALMPELFGLKRVSYWQAWGLFALCSILFKGSGSSGSGNKSDRKRKKQLRGYMEEGREACGDQADKSAEASDAQPRT